MRFRTKILAGKSAQYLICSFWGMPGDSREEKTCFTQRRQDRKENLPNAGLHQLGPGGRRGVGLVGRQIPRGDDEGFAVGVEARGLSGDISGRRRVGRGRWVRRGRVRGFGCLGLGEHDGFVW